MKYQKIGLLFLALPALLVGCDDDDVEDLLRQPARVAVFNFMTDRAQQDAAKQPINMLTELSPDFAIEDLDYSSNGVGLVRLRLESDTQTLGVTLGNVDGDLVSEDVDFSADKTYSLVLSGERTVDADMHVSEQVLPARSPAATEVFVRFTHVLSAQSAEKLEVDGNAGLIAYQGSSAFLAENISAGEITVDVETESGGNVGTLSCDVTGGEVYEAFIAHTVFDSTLPELFCFRLVQ